MMMMMMQVDTAERRTEDVEVRESEQVEPGDRATAAAATNDENNNAGQQNTTVADGVDVQVTAADDPDVITTNSLTLPRIEQVLRSEGVRPLSISQQIDSLRRKVARCVHSNSLNTWRFFC